MIGVEYARPSPLGVTQSWFTSRPKTNSKTLITTACRSGAKGNRERFFRYLPPRGMSIAPTRDRILGHTSAEGSAPETEASSPQRIRRPRSPSESAAAPSVSCSALLVGTIGDLAYYPPVFAQPLAQRPARVVQPGLDSADRAIKNVRYLGQLESLQIKEYDHGSLLETQ